MDVIRKRELYANTRLMLATVTNRPVGLNKAPAPDENGKISSPWSIVYSIEGGGFSGPPLEDPHADATVVVQVTSVGRRDDQAEWQADKVRGAMLDRTSGALDHPITPPDGYKIMYVEPDGGPGGIDREGELYSIPERFAIHLTPA
jgi:hypothetical protein